MASWNGTLSAICERNPPITGCDVSFDIGLNKQLNEQSTAILYQRHGRLYWASSSEKKNIHAGTIPGGGPHFVRVMGRLRGIDPPFSRHWEKISILDPPFLGF